MTDLIKDFNTKQVEKLKKDIPSFKAGDTVKVNYKITEGATTRIQAFEGVVIGISKQMNNYKASFVVRKISSGIGVERKFMLYSPLVESIAVVKKGIVNRAKLYYLRNLTGRAARIKEKLDFTLKEKSSEKKAKKAKEDKVETKEEVKKPEVKKETPKKETKEVVKKEEKK